MKTTTIPTEILPDDLVPVKVAAGLARCNLATCYRWILAGKLRAWKRCGRHFVSRAELLGLFRPVAPRRPAEGPTYTAVQEAEARAWTQEVLTRAGLL